MRYTEIAPFVYVPQDASYDSLVSKLRITPGRKVKKATTLAFSFTHNKTVFSSVPGSNSTSTSISPMQINLQLSLEQGYTAAEVSVALLELVHNLTPSVMNSLLSGGRGPEVLNLLTAAPSVQE